MQELIANQSIPESSRVLRFKVELYGGTATLYNKLSDGTPEAVRIFDGEEPPTARRFNHEIVEGEEWYFEYTGKAKAFYR